MPQTERSALPLHDAVRAVAAALGRAVGRLDVASVSARFREQDELVVLPDFLEPDEAAALAAAAADVAPGANRSFVPGFKKSGSLSRRQLAAGAPVFNAMYEDATLHAFLEQVTGRELVRCPDHDLHGVALYLYTEPGDHIGWHYDTSFYRGARYTLLIGLVDESSCLLECELHRRDASRPNHSLGVSLKPGTLVLFNGDTIWHHVTPLGADERRICLTMEFLTDARMSFLSRIVSEIKDRVGYFGWRAPSA